VLSNTHYVYSDVACDPTTRRHDDDTLLCTTDYHHYLPTRPILTDGSITKLSAGHYTRYLISLLVIYIGCILALSQLTSDVSVHYQTLFTTRIPHSSRDYRYVTTSHRNSPPTSRLSLPTIDRQQRHQDSTR
jgi:hypothetical protein